MKEKKSVCSYIMIESHGKHFQNTWLRNLCAEKPNDSLVGEIRCSVTCIALPQCPSYMGTSQYLDNSIHLFLSVLIKAMGNHLRAVYKGTSKDIMLMSYENTQGRGHRALTPFDTFLSSSAMYSSSSGAYEWLGRIYAVVYISCKQALYPVTPYGVTHLGSANGLSPVRHRDHMKPQGTHNLTTTKQNTTKPCAYSMGCIAYEMCYRSLAYFNGRRFADDTFKRIFSNENVRISIKISLKFVPKGPIDNIPALV